MSKWYFAFNNAPLRPELQDKLNKFGILKALPETYLPNEQNVRFISNFFTPDGFPHLSEGTKATEVNYPYIFPAIAPWYTGAAIPAALAEMDPMFRQTACTAALRWLHTLTDAADPNGPQEKATETFHGLAFQEVYGGVNYTFAFPDTRIDTNSHGPAAIVLIADSYWNNEAWEKSGSVPLYAKQQALFQLWCWDHFASKCGYQIEAPTTAFIVRICGNLPIDCTIRTLDYNPAEAEALVTRICKAKAQEQQKGLYWKRYIDKPQSWMEKLTNEAFHPNDPDLHELIVQYMKARSNRKAIEREVNEVTEKMEGIAVKLATMIPAGAIQGKYTLPDGTICTVSHQARRSRSGNSVSADLVRSLFPELSGCISTSETRRQYLTIEAL